MRDWKQYCSNKQAYNIKGDVVTVELSKNRKHDIRVIELQHGYKLRGRVLEHKNCLPDIDIFKKIGEGNRNIYFAAFHFDNDRNVVGESWIPEESMSSENFLMQMKKLALECDRMEFVLTGKDYY